MPKVKERMIRKSNRPTVKEYLKERLRHIPTTVVMALFILFCLGSSIYFMVLGGDRLRDMGFGFAFIVLVLLFYVIEYALNVRVPIGYTVFFILFMVFNFAGAVYNLYTLIPCLDDILHAAWGIVFGIMGITIIKVLVGAPKTAKSVIAYVLFGLGFAMLTSIIWEIYEFTGDSILPSMDMQQGTVVDHIHSFIMYPDPANPAPDNLHTWQVEGIARTVLYDAEGNIIGIIPNGYLDLGLLDTMYDLIFCFVATVVFSVALAVDWCKGKYLYRFIIPALVGEKYDRHGNMVEGGAIVATAAEAEERPVEGDEVAQEN
ncbi:MAG: hypothetical protein K2O62_00415 [Clostridia bacterium]|nr:hypothetical protein [Clostridia bacterium]